MEFYFLKNVVQSLHLFFFFLNLWLFAIMFRKVFRTPACYKFFLLFVIFVFISRCVTQPEHFVCVFSGKDSQLMKTIYLEMFLTTQM